MTTHMQDTIIANAAYAMGNHAGRSRHKNTGSTFVSSTDPTTRKTIKMLPARCDSTDFENIGEEQRRCSKTIKIRQSEESNDDETGASVSGASQRSYSFVRSSGAQQSYNGRVTTQHRLSIQWTPKDANIDRRISNCSCRSNHSINSERPVSTCSELTDRSDSPSISNDKKKTDDRSPVRVYSSLSDRPRLFSQTSSAEEQQCLDLHKRLSFEDATDPIKMDVAMKYRMTRQRNGANMGRRSTIFTLSPLQRLMHHNVLSDERRQLMQETWVKIKSAHDGQLALIGCHIFTRVFKQCPELRVEFNVTQISSGEDLIACNQFHRFAHVFTQLIDLGVRNVYDLDSEMSPILRMYGRRHAKRGSASGTEFHIEYMRVIMDACEKFILDQLVSLEEITQPVDDSFAIWKLLFAFILTKMTDGVHEQMIDDRRMTTSKSSLFAKTRHRLSTLKKKK